MSGRQDAWHPDWIAALRRLHERGLSHGLKADRLTEMFGREFTRSAVLGKCRRLGLATITAVPTQRVKKNWARAKTAAAGKPGTPAVPAVPTALRRPRVSADAPALVAATPVTLLARKRWQCCWPVNDGDPFLFCGAPKLAAHPQHRHEPDYCLFHQWLAIGSPAARHRFMETCA